MKRKRISQAGEPASTRRQPPLNRPHRILVVEEDSDLRMLYADVLTGLDYHVDSVADGAAGWKALQAGRYSLLITDSDLPKLTGVELVQKLRAERMALPVVMTAARLPEHELARHPPLQLAGTLLKPFAVEVLLDTVRQVLYATDLAPDAFASRPKSPGRPPAAGWQL